MSRALAVVTAVAMVLIGARLVLAHAEPIQGDVSLTPAEPRIGEETWVVVQLYGGNSGVPLEGAQVKVIGEMTGHTMTPVEAALSAGGDGGQYSGLMTFTMTGSWNLRLQITHQGEHAEQVITATVRGEDGERDDTTSLQSFTFTLEADPPPYPLLILGMAASLILGLMAMAIVRRRMDAASEAKRRDV